MFCLNVYETCTSSNLVFAKNSYSPKNDLAYHSRGITTILFRLCFWTYHTLPVKLGNLLLLLSLWFLLLTLISIVVTWYKNVILLLQRYECSMAKIIHLQVKTEFRVLMFSFIFLCLPDYQKNEFYMY